MTRPILIAAESAADSRAVAGLADEVFVDAVDWLEPETLDGLRSWVGVEPGATWVDVHRLPSLGRSLRAYGHFDGRPGAADALMVRKLLRLAATREPAPVAVVVSRDMDDQPDRRVGFEQAAQERAWPFVVVGAYATPELEAWRIALWRPTSAGAKARLGEQRERLGFDPTARPDRLASRGPRDAKLVLDALTGDDAVDEAWWVGAHERVGQAHAACGLAGYVDDVRERLLPALLTVSERRA